MALRKAVRFHRNPGLGLLSAMVVSLLLTCSGASTQAQGVLSNGALQSGTISPAGASARGPSLLLRARESCCARGRDELHPSHPDL